MTTSEGIAVHVSGDYPGPDHESVGDPQRMTAQSGGAMSDHDPFAEPDDTDRTVIRPNPGARRPVAAQPPFAAAQSAGPRSVSEARAPPRRPPQPAQRHRPTGMNELVALATPLFSLISRIRNRAQHLDPEKLRQSVVAEVRRFEKARSRPGSSRRTSRSPATRSAQRSTTWC
jgi:hypothetical protein